MSDRCTSCGATIRWVEMTLTGKHMPIDPQPHAQGNIFVYQMGGRAHALIAPKFREGSVRYRSHFASCPNAKEHRRG